MSLISFVSKSGDFLSLYASIGDDVRVFFTRGYIHKKCAKVTGTRSVVDRITPRSDVIVFELSFSKPKSNAYTKASTKGTNATQKKSKDNATRVEMFFAI